MLIQICLEPIGNFDINNVVSLFSNVDDFQTPLYDNILVSTLLPPNCPLELEVPDGTEVIKLFDIENFNCLYLPIIDGLCEQCDFSFDVEPSSNGSLLICGNLVNNNLCVSEDWVLKYRIEWINQQSEVVLVTGYGNGFFDFNFQHPLTNNNSVPLPPGTYTPILTHIWIDWNDNSFPYGVVYNSSETYEGVLPTNAPLYAMPINLCLDYTVTIDSWNCNNGLNLGNYTHSVIFEGTSSMEPPVVVSQNFEIGIDTKYFAWSFRAYNQPDTIKITLHSQSYEYPIILEWYTIGKYSVTPNTETFPRRIKGDKVSKMTKIEHYNILNGDFLEITVSSNNQFTQWDLLMKCIDYEIDCNSCIFYPENRPRLVESTLSFFNQNLYCGSQTLQDYNLKVLISTNDGCSNLTDNDFYRYLQRNTMSSAYISEDVGQPSKISHLYIHTDFSKSIVASFKRSTQTATISTQSFLSQYCYSNSNNTIHFMKNSGVGEDLIIHMQDETLYNHFISNFTSMQNVINNLNLQETDPVVNIDYYTVFRFDISLGINENWECSYDGITTLSLNIHWSTEITYGDLDETTKFINITLPQITNQYDGVDLCGVINPKCDDIVDMINSSISETLDIINYNSLSVTKPFSKYYKITTQLSNPNYLSFRIQRDIAFHKHILETIPLNAETLETLPSLSSTTCPDLLNILPTWYNSSPNYGPPGSFRAILMFNYDAKFIGSNSGPMYEWAIRDRNNDDEWIATGNSLTNEYLIINPEHFI